MTMWNPFSNILASLQTYGDLTPDLKLRQQVTRKLCQRPDLTLETWFESFYQPQGVSHAVASFAYEHLAQYSGLEVGRLLPDDRLEADLTWTEICWFDWDLRLYEDFWQQFGVDISDAFDPTLLSTVEDLVVWLNDAARGQNLPPSLDFPNP